MSTTNDSMSPLKAEANERAELPSRVTMYLVIGLIAAVLSVYAIVARADFIHFDDNNHVFENPLVVGGLSWTSIEKAFQPHASLWVPLTTISFMTDVSLFGLNPGAMHIENLLWHTAATVLLFLTLRRTTGQLWPSVVVAALFGLHPLNVESVAWITERKNVICAFFWIASIAAYARYAERSRWSAYGLAHLFTSLALLAKPMAVTLPFTLLLLDYWPLQRFREVSLRRLVLEKIPFFALAGAASAIAIIAREESYIVALETVSLAGRLSNALVSYTTYLGQMVYPVHLGIFYPHPVNTQPGLALLAAALLLAISIAAWLNRKRAPYLLFGWLWYLGTLVPMIGFVQAGSQARADRFTYIPQLGIFIAAVWLIAKSKIAVSRTTTMATAGFLVVCGVLTAQQASRWLDGATIFEHTISVTANNACAYTNAGLHRAREGDFQKAIEHFQASLDILPEQPSTWRELGKSLLCIHKPKQAVEVFRAGLKQQPNDYEMRYQLAISLRESGETIEAINALNQLLTAVPKSSGLHYHLGLALAQIGRKEEALAHLATAAELAPNDSKIKQALQQISR